MLLEKIWVFFQLLTIIFLQISYNKAVIFTDNKQLHHSIKAVILLLHFTKEFTYCLNKGST